MTTLCHVAVLVLAMISVVAAFPFSNNASRGDVQENTPALISCLQNAQVPLSLASYSNFAQLALPYNLRLQYAPAAIALPTTPAHVSSAVMCAVNAGVKVQAKSGGHSYASFSSGGQNGSLIIDMESFQEISLDNSTGVATVGTGVRLGNLAQGIFDQGRRALPHGTCPG